MNLTFSLLKDVVPSTSKKTIFGNKETIEMIKKIKI
jgi:hypothetical protein